MVGHLRNRHFFLSDLLLLPLAAYLSYVLRLDSVQLHGFGRSCLTFAALATLITPALFLVAGVYSRFWRYASVEELQLLIGAVATSVTLVSGASLLALRFMPGYQVLPRSIPFIFLLLALAFTAGPRLGVRLLAGY